MKCWESHHPYAIVTIVFWSLAYVLTRLALRHFSAFSLGFLRYLVASATLLIVAVATKSKLPAKRHSLLFIASGTMGFFLYMITFNKGAETVTASTASFIISIVPVLTALLARVALKERLRALQWVAVGIEFSGILVLTLHNGTFSLRIGIVWMLLAAFALSGYNLLQRLLTRTYPALTATMYSVFSGTMLLAVFATASVGELRNAPPVQFVYIAVLGVFSGALAYVAWSKAFELARKTSNVSNYMFVTPLLTSLLGFVIAGETVDTPTLISGAIILSGMVLFNKAAALQTA